MEILIPMVLASLALVAGAVAFFAWTVRQRTFDHADRLALLPLEDDAHTPETEEREHA